VTTADKWGFTGDMSAEYDVDIAYNDDFAWDGDVNAVSDSLQVFTKRPINTISHWIVGLPYPTEDEGGKKLRVRVHIGAPSWMGGPGIDYQVAARFTKKITINQQLGEDTKYNDDLATYRTLLKDWTDKRDAALAAAQKAADAFEQRMIAGLSPVNEMVSQIIEQHFPAGVRDECWEIDYWQRVFDWDRASFVAYPSWWGTGDMRNVELDPSDFLNASWAKLYLPVRAGMELHALRWIFGKAVARRLAKEMEARFGSLVDDLRTFRGQSLGTPDEAPELTTECQQVPERVYCLAAWTEVMPTDGTHLEVIQGITSAADAITAKEIEDAAGLRVALLESEQRSAKLKDKAIDQMTEPASIDINIGSDGTPAP
jgi:hypothetical protein